MIVSAIATAHIDGHGNFFQIAQGIGELADKNNRLHAQIGEERNSYQRHEGCEAWSAYKSFYQLTYRSPVISTRIVARAVEEWFQEFGKGYRCPDHQDSQTHKPLEQSNFIGVHHVDGQ